MTSESEVAQSCPTPSNPKGAGGVKAASLLTGNRAPTAHTSCGESGPHSPPLRQAPGIALADPVVV